MVVVVMVVGCGLVEVVNGGLRGWLLQTKKESNRKRERERNE